jgi:hypothetical protein
MENIKRILLIGLLFIIATPAFPQKSDVQAMQKPAVEMADSFRADGKIYVVVAIILVILLGFIVYLFLLDKKLGKIEKQIGLKD